MASILFSAPEFRAQFPGQFPNPPNSDALLEVYWNQATCHVTADTAGPLPTNCRRDVINLVTAHLITLAEQTIAGEQSGFVESASIDKISVKVLAPPPGQTYIAWFLGQTPFGQQAYSLLMIHGRGLYYGGNNELGQFKRAGGEFTPPGEDSSLTQRTDVDACQILALPPPAPYTLDFGLISGGANNIFASVLGGCEVLSCEFDGAAPGVEVSFLMYTGTDVDLGSRINIHYWTSDDRAAGNGPTLTWFDRDPTGLTGFEGIILDVGIVTGSTGANPNLLAITGFETDVAINMNVSILVAVT